MTLKPAAEESLSAALDSGVAQVLDGQARDLGEFVVRRVLPAKTRRLVGPFIFFDHMGPVAFPPNAGVNVRPHPHIGLATVTYLFEGEIVHRDSLGFTQTIRAGDINWMIAGRGIVHSERTAPERLRSGGNLHGLQLWLALPSEHEESEPSFQHHASATLPERSEAGVKLRVLAGSAYGMTSPVKALSPLCYVDISLTSGSELQLPSEHAERALYVVAGAVVCGSVRAEPGRMLVFASDANVTLRAEGATRAVLIGGAPLDGPRHVYWNFVASSPARLERAKQDWKHGRFPKVPGDDQEFIPLPET